MYPRSFADSDGDGIGDINGIRERLPYLADLGVDAIWISPWYPSPLLDGGYDVADYRDVNPQFGTLADADALIAAAHDLDIRVLIDLVPNHCSWEHPWFRAALAAGRGSPERELFWFRDGPTGRTDRRRPTAGRPPSAVPPGNRSPTASGTSTCSTSASPIGTGSTPTCSPSSTRSCASGSTAASTASASTSPTRWPRTTRCPTCASRASPASPPTSIPGTRTGTATRCTTSTAGGVASPTSTSTAPAARGCSWRRRGSRHRNDSPATSDGDELHCAFNFDALKAKWDAKSQRQVIDDSTEAIWAVGAPATWVLSNHDTIRHRTRYGRDQADAAAPAGSVPSDLELGLRRARAAVLLELALPGGAYIYQGDELGLPEVEDLPEDTLDDPIWERSGRQVRGRDGCRVPMPWSGEEPPFGFGPGRGQPWLPQPDRWASLTAERQAGDPTSHLTLYRTALALRRRHPALGDGRLEWVDTAADVLCFDRHPGFRCVVNFGPSPCALPSHREVLLTSVALEDGRLPSDAAAWLSR